MDLSVLAAVGSFVVSERVLKPKASVLFILACVLAYDLTTKTHDVSSLRVYRGPAMVAFCLFMAAYSLRTWRRNGVACDEFLFLPGTPHGQTHGIDSPLVVAGSGNNSDQQSQQQQLGSANTNNNHGNYDRNRLLRLSPPVLSEGDVAAGVGMANHNNNNSNSRLEARNNNNTENSNTNSPISARTRRRNNSNHQVTTSSTAAITTPTRRTTAAAASTDHRRNSPLRSQSDEIRQHPSTPSNDNTNSLGLSRSMDEDAIMDREDFTTNATTTIADSIASHRSSSIRKPKVSFDFAFPWESDNDDDDDDNDNNYDDNEDTSNSGQESSLLPRGNDDATSRDENNNNTRRKNTRRFFSFSIEEGREQSQQDDNNVGSSSSASYPEENNSNETITRIGSFFFFRSSSTSTHNAEYAPSGPAVVGAALDLSMPILFNFHLFIEAYNSVTQNGGSEAQAKILPLIFLTVLLFRTSFPPGRRGRFWSTIKFAVTAPFHRIRFRDAFVGDVITSLVRPGQDLLFALSYYLTVIWGSITGRYGLSQSGQLLQKSWLLHNVILPSWALLPLWWKFLQTLRQVYDEKQRWPHYGNSFKYFTATIIILYGMNHKEDDRSSWWIVCFLLAVFYQIWWDTVMDWELFIITPRSESDAAAAAAENRSDGSNNSLSSWLLWCTSPRISSLQPNSHILLNLQMYIFQPMEGMIRRISHNIPHYSQIQLRPKRLYKTKKFYYRIFCYNTLLRFTWMLCFIPAYRLSKRKTADNTDDTEFDVTFSSDVHSYVGVLLPVAEIVRRCFWGILLLEKETIKMRDSDGHCVITAYQQLETSERAADDNDAASSSSVDGDDDIALDQEDQKLLSMKKNGTDGGGGVELRATNSNLEDDNNEDSNNDDDDDDQSRSRKEGSSLLLSSPSSPSSSLVSRLTIPTWMNTQQKLQHDAARGSNGGSSSSAHIRSKLSLALQFIRSEAFCEKLLLFELIVWVIAFIGFGIWATK